MFRSAIRQSSRLFAAARPAAAASTGIRTLPVQSSTILPSISAVPQSLFGIRFYSSGGAPPRADIEARIVDLLKGFDKITDPSKITSKAHFSNDLGLDSLDTVEVVMAIEEEFSVEIPDKEADAILSVEQAVEYIANQPGAV
ncbi:hypothetical protein TWF694_009122 [Orbilia ellipsospora]|uniref:Acyl carrier protein n=1 Tax=Orbilia ellipsospora TaxID=2528407 RepID=A0AAV9XE11_9PEZI